MVSNEGVAAATDGAAAVWDPRTTHLVVGATTNLRDLGGVPAADGGVVASGRAYRAEALVEPGTTDLCSILDPTHTEAYRALGVRTVVDLRSVQEIGRVASAWPGATGADYVALPVEEGGEGDAGYVAQIRAGVRTRFTAEDLAHYYGLTLRRRAAEFGAALRVFTDAARLPVLVHCAAGKDRTGLTIALLLEALGVDRADVVSDYALTGVLRPDRVQAYAHLFADTDVNLADIATLFDSPAEAMADALAGLDAEYGSVTGYLRSACGLDPAELAALRANLLISPP